MLKIIKKFSTSLIVANLSFVSLNALALEEITSDNELGKVAGQANLAIVVKEAHVQIDNSAWYDTFWANGTQFTGGILLLDDLALDMTGTFILDVNKEKKGEPGSLVLTIQDLNVSGSIQHIRIGSEFDVNNDFLTLGDRLKDPGYLENGNYGFSSSVGGMDFYMKEVNGVVKLTPGGKYGKSGFKTEAELSFASLGMHWYDDGNSMGFDDASGSISAEGTIDLQPYTLNGIEYKTLEINTTATVNATVGNMSIGEGSIGGLGIGNMKVTSQVNVFASK